MFTYLPFLWFRVRAALAAAFLLFAAACGDSNPLIGDWTLDGEALPAAVRGVIAMAGGGDSLTFKDDHMVIDGRSVLVTYLIEDDMVTVVPEGENSGDVFRVIDRTHIELVMPIIGGLVFVKD